MATQKLTATPTKLKNGASDLTEDTWYTIQNRGNQSFYVETATSTPSNTENAFVISPFSLMQVKVTGSEEIYISQDDKRGDGSFGTIVIEPSA
ncbi:MAG: hypothetical protein ISN29_10750 [Gammaproteobacteria bacterium AqS3]|nr:hypothetical protein [Gammaproteobacteria bacterium AqS3]